MTRFMILTAGALTALTMTTAAVQAQDRPQRGPDFAELDADGNGQLTPAEMRAHAAARFAVADSDANGTLSAEELTAAAAARQAERAGRRTDRMIEWMDADGDGALSPAEMPRRGSARMFARADANDDGALSAEEFAEARMHRRGNGQGHGEGRKSRN